MQLKTKNATFAPKATRIKICVIIQIGKGTRRCVFSYLHWEIRTISCGSIVFQKPHYSDTKHSLFPIPAHSLFSIPLENHRFSVYTKQYVFF